MSSYMEDLPIPRAAQASSIRRAFRSTFCWEAARFFWGRGAGEHDCVVISANLCARLQVRQVMGAEMWFYGSTSKAEARSSDLALDSKVLARRG